MADSAACHEVQHLDEFKSLNSEQKLNVLFTKLHRTEQKLKTYETLLTDIKSLQTEVNVIQDNVKLLDTNVEGLAEQVCTLQTSIDNHSNSITKNKNSLDTLLKRDTEKNEKLTKNNQTILEQEIKIKTLQQEINDLEQYGRRTMCVIQGIPYKKDEDTDNIIKNIIDKMDSPVDYNKIDISHRQRNDENAGIIVKFVDRKSRNSFYDARKVLQDRKTSTKALGYTIDRPFYINESLTQLNGDIFKDARKKLLKTGRMKYVWTTSNGQIKAKRGDAARTYNIRTKEDTAKLEVKYQPLQELITK